MSRTDTYISRSIVGICSVSDCVWLTATHCLALAHAVCQLLYTSAGVAEAQLCEAGRALSQSRGQQAHEGQEANA